LPEKRRPQPDGAWEITAVIDDGRVIQPTDVLLNYAADGRVVVRGQTVELVVPTTYQRKRLPFVVDDTKSPMTFDLAGAEKTGNIVAGKDTLVVPGEPGSPAGVFGRCRERAIAGDAEAAAGAMAIHCFRQPPTS
jgi:hypothetical protein